MALEYCFLISTKIEPKIFEEYLKTKDISFSKETFVPDVYFYASDHLGYITYFSYAKNREITYCENGVDESFYSHNISTKLTIRINKFYDYDQVCLEVYDMVLFLVRRYPNDCILRYLDSYMIFIRTNGIFTKGEFAKKTLFKDIDN